MTDPASYRLSRSPSFMNRPAQSPMGPRTRFPRSAASSPDIASSRESFLLSPLGEPSPMYPLSPATPEPVLPAISEQEPPELPPPPITSPPPPPTLPYQPPAFKVIPKQAMLARAPAISFESVPVAFKSLPLEGFLCKSFWLKSTVLFIIFPRDPQQQRAPGDGITGDPVIGP